MTDTGRYTLVLPAGEIPDGMQVTKRTGQKAYQLTRKIRVFAQTEGSKTTDRQEIIPAPGSVYLLADEQDACIQQIPDSTQLGVHFESIEELQEFLDDLAEEEDK